MGKMGTLQTWGRALLDFAYPPHCAVCEADIEAAELLCGSCWAEIGSHRPHLQTEDGSRAFEQVVSLGLLPVRCNRPFTRLSFATKCG